MVKMGLNDIDPLLTDHITQRRNNLPGGCAALHHAEFDQGYAKRPDCSSKLATGPQGTDHRFETRRIKPLENAEQQIFRTTDRKADENMKNPGFFHKKYLISSINPGTHLT